MNRKILISVFLLIVILASLVIGFYFLNSYIYNEKQAPETSQCPKSLVFTTPVDINLVTSVLYPGQVRGGDFKPHGGFRFDNSTNEITVRAPFDAKITSASRYIENGKIQYLFEFETACGLKYRFDHLVALSAKLEGIVSNLPEAKVDDTRTTFINEQIEVEENEVIATSVGSTGNVFVDFGVYSLGEDNLRDQGLCIFDYLSPEDSKHLRTLPAGNEGKTSQYCN